MSVVATSHKPRQVVEEHLRVPEEPADERKSKVAKIQKLRAATQGNPTQSAPAQSLSVQVQTVALEDIDQANQMFQFRLSIQVDDLLRSLERDGLEQPVDLVGPKPYRIVDGFRRCKAASQLGWDSVQCVIHEIADRQALGIAFTKNVVRRSLAPMDKANALWIAQKQGCKKSEVLELFGISHKQAERYLELLEFTPALQKCIDGKVVTMAHAKVLHDFGVDTPSEWKARIESECLSAKQLQKLLKGEGGRKPTRGQCGRKKLYIKKSKDCLRIYAFSITRDTSPADKERVVKVLREALEFLQKETLL